MEELACLFCEVHNRFYSTSTYVYCDAMDEVGEMASAMGYTMNDLAKVCTWS